MNLEPALRTRLVAPPAATADIPGIGGVLRARSDDFRVDEVAAYPPDGREDRHLLVRFEKRDLTTADAVHLLCERTRVQRRDVGVPGRKDKFAVTTQWVSFPVSARDVLEGFDHPALRILEVAAHGQKLRTGHLRANRFEVVVRNLSVGLEEARARVVRKLEVLREAGGLENLYGPQRFGRDASNLERGLAALGAPRFDRRDTFMASAAQAALFNLYVLLRRERGWLKEVLSGDILKKADTGGMFWATDVAAEQERLERGELFLTGPIFGAKTKAPPTGTAAAALEDEVLEEVQLDREGLARHGKRLPGTRRLCMLSLDALGAFDVETAPPVDGLGEGLLLRFTLPSGSFATQVARELQVGPDTADPLASDTMHEEIDA